MSNTTTTQSVASSKAARSAKAAASPSGIPASSSLARFGDKIYAAAIFLASLSIFAIIVWLFSQLIQQSSLSAHTFGLSFLTDSKWDENIDSYHAKPFIVGTIYSSVIALLISVPLSIGAAIFLSELAPAWIRTPATFLIELLAAIPSVVYGLWGIFILVPFLAAHVVEPIMASKLPHLPIIGALFSGTNHTGNSMLAAGVILAIMTTPFITAVARDILRAIPRAQREGSYALGATQWETISRVVLPYAKSGIIGAVILGLGRALGETMAVTMVIGNQAPNNQSGLSWSLFDTGYTMASVLANKFQEAIPGLATSALVEVALVLFGVTICVNIIARLLVRYTAKDAQGRH